jgi:antitoxin component YwqK of YwqJK toxin-antitoxin module
MKSYTLTRKKILILAAVLLAGAIFFVILFFIQKTTYNKISALKAIPPDASIVIEIKDFSSFSEATAFFKPLSVWRNIPEINDVFDQFGNIVSLTGSSKETARLAQHANLVISVMYRDNTFSYLFAVEMSEIYKFSEIVEGISPMIQSLGFSALNERKGDNRMELLNSTDTIHIGHFSNIILISSNLGLIEQSLKSLETEEKNPWEEFSNAKHHENTLFSVFTKEGSLHKLIGVFFQEDRMFPAEIFPDSGCIDFINTGESLQLEMRGSFKQSVLNFPTEFQELYTWRNALSDMAFATTGSLSASDLPSQIKQWLGDTFYEVIFRPQPGDKHPSSLILISVSDTSAFLKNIRSFTEKLPADIEKEFYFQECFAAKLKNDSMFRHYENAPANLQANKYIALCGHTLLVSPFASALEKALEDFVYEQSDTLSEDFDMNEYSLYIHLPGFYPFLMISARENSFKSIEELYTVISHFTHFEYYIHPEQHDLRTIDIHFDDNGPVSPLKGITDLQYLKFLWHNEFIFDSLQKFPVKMYNDHEDGNQNFFSADSSLIAQGIYESGKATGTWRFHYPDSSYQASIEFENGKPHGKAVYYRKRPTGKMHVSCSYEKGEFSGQYIEFHKNGKPSMSVVYKNGKISGKIRCYYPGGTIMSEVGLTDISGGNQYLFYSVTGDFIDPEIFSAPSLILGNYMSFINAQRMALGE